LMYYSSMRWMQVNMSFSVNTS